MVFLRSHLTLPRLLAQGMSLSYNICLSFIGGFAASVSQSLHLGRRPLSLFATVPRAHRRTHIDTEALTRSGFLTDALVYCSVQWTTKAIIRQKSKLC